jgi:hypothetical protein
MIKKEYIKLTVLQVALITMCLSVTSKVEAQTMNKTDNLWQAQQMCDELLNECDGLLVQQAMMYGELKVQTNELQKELDKRNRQVFELQNPVWYRDAKYTGISGILIGIFLTLSLQNP